MHGLTNLSKNTPSRDLASRDLSWEVCRGFTPEFEQNQIVQGSSVAAVQESGMGADGKADPSSPEMLPKCPARILIVEDHWCSPETKKTEPDTRNSKPET